MSAIDPSFVKFLCESLLEHYTYRNACDLDGEGGMLDPFASEEVFEPVQDRSGLPPGVQEALDHYQGLIAARDLGGVSLYRLTLGSALWTYLLRVTTDGDDGWLEVFDSRGACLGAARTYLELACWGEPRAIRALAQDFGYPPELDDRRTRTLWARLRRR